MELLLLLLRLHGGMLELLLLWLLALRLLLLALKLLLLRLHGGMLELLLLWLLALRQLLLALKLLLLRLHGGMLELLLLWLLVMLLQGLGCCCSHWNCRCCCFWS